MANSDREISFFGVYSIKSGKTPSENCYGTAVGAQTSIKTSE